LLLVEGGRKKGRKEKRDEMEKGSVVWNVAEEGK
jgi:hypothetical protein